MAEIDPLIEDEGNELHIPFGADLELASVLRGWLVGGKLNPDRAAEVVVDYSKLPFSRHEHVKFLPRILELRHNVSAYDAAYIALVESLNADLLTTDSRLARAAAELGVSLAL
ncbi:MAG: type II toxin-antitoxin system VapC family toxin [Solirubrobacterales bacterium]